MSRIYLALLSVSSLVLLLVVTLPAYANELSDVSPHPRLKFDQDSDRSGATGSCPHIQGEWS